MDDQTEDQDPPAVVTVIHQVRKFYTMYNGRVKLQVLHTQHLTLKLSY